MRTIGLLVADTADDPGYQARLGAFQAKPINHAKKMEGFVAPVIGRIRATRWLYPYYAQ